MATTTTNFGWDIPQSTDLVKDGATAIAALGQDIDTALVDLKGGTTGQVLAKASGSDLDFSWVAQDDSNAIQNAIVDAKGDLIAATANDTPARLAVGTNGQVLTADSTAATGLAWAAPSSGALSLITTQTFSTVSAVNLNDIFSTTYDHYKIIMSLTASTGSDILGRLRVSGADDTSANYDTQRLTASNATASAARVTAQTAWEISDYNGAQFAVDMMIYNPFKSIKTNAISQSTVESPPVYYLRTDLFQQTTSFTGFSVIARSGTISGTMTVWGFSK
jgi:hypothetical protein